MTDDSELLRLYAEEGQESAFAELVQRKAALVYSAALRQVNGDMLLAQDVAQSVFIDLARKARAVSNRPVLTSWLYVSTRFAALKALRAKHRREVREREAQLMHDTEISSGSEVNWDNVRPLLDAAICDLSERDRTAVLMRYFEGQPFAAIAQRLQLGESSARMRAERALEKLRLNLHHKGITSTAAALALAIGTHAVAAPPAGLATTWAGGALACVSAGAGVSGGVGVLFKASQAAAMKKLQTGAMVTLALAATGFASYEADEHAKSRAFLIYGICFSVGLIFALVSAIFGHIASGHGEIGHGGAGHEGGAHGHAEAGAGANDMPGFAPIGPTTIATFVTAFGGLGMILSRMNETRLFSGFVAAGGALLIATCVGWFFSVVFKRTQSTSEGRVADLIGQHATVITRIPESGVGEIAYVQGGSRYSAPARTSDGRSVATGETVSIVRIVGAQFYVNAK